MSCLSPEASSLCMDANADFVTQYVAKMHTHMHAHTNTHTHAAGLLPARKSSNTSQVPGDHMWINAKLYCDLALQLCELHALGELFNANKQDDREHSGTQDAPYFNDFILSASNILITHLSYTFQMLEEFHCSSVLNVSSPFNECI